MKRPLDLFRNLGLSAKLNIVLITVFVVLLIVMLFVINANVVNFTAQTGQQRVLQELDVISKRLVEQEQDTLQAVTLLGSRPGLVGSLKSKDLTTLRTVALSSAALLGLDNVDVANADGAVVLRLANGQARTTDSGALSKDELNLLTFGLNGMNPTGLVNDTTVNDPTLLIGAVVPLHDPDNVSSVIGALFGGRVINTALLNQIDFGRDDVHMAVVRDNQIIARDQVETGDAGKANDPQTLNGISLDNAMVSQALVGQTTSADRVVYATGQLPFVMGYAPLSIGGKIVGAVMIQVRLNQIVAFGYQISTALSLILAIVAAFVLGIVGLFFHHLITRPLNKLKLVSDQMANGNYGQRTSLNSLDEVGQLGNSFNQMAEMIQKRQDELRAATVKAKEATRLKSEFLANISHELRTPLNAIIGFSDMFLVGMLGDLTPGQHHKMERLRENGNRLLTLINNLLDLTRIEARRVEVVNKPFAPRTLLERISAQMSVLAEQKKLSFNIVIGPELPETLLGDEPRIEQIVVNILSNAIKFTEKGAVNVNAMVNQAEKTWSIAVSDTGIGIPPHALDLIFEEFRQVDGSTTRAYQGTGLGLAIARNLARIMEGDISVRSELSKGSTFTLTLPLNSDATEFSPKFQTVTEMAHG